MPLSNSENGNDYISAPQPKLTEHPNFCKKVGMLRMDSDHLPFPYQILAILTLKMRYGGSLYVLKLAAHLKTEKCSGISETNFIATRYIR